MAKPSAAWAQKRWLFPLLVAVSLSLSTALAFLLRAAFDSSCDRHTFVVPDNRFDSDRTAAGAGIGLADRNPLGFMKSKRVLLVSHELSLSGGPLLLMELAFLLRGVGAEVCWITNQKPSGTDEVVDNLEHKMLGQGVQVLSAKGQEAVGTALKADLVVLNTAVAGKWLDAVLKENVHQVLPKVLWWIHEMRGHYFKMDYVKHLPLVSGAMIDSHVTAEYWKNRTQERLKIKMPDTYVVHLGNSKELMDVAEDSVAKRVLREHVRESLGVRNDDIIFGLINSVSRGKGQDLFLRAFYESLLLIQEKKLVVPSLHAVIVGSDMTAQTKFESELRDFVTLKKIQNRVHFVNKTLTVAPYLAAIDVLVQNSQARGECFGRITIEAMAFQLPVLGTSAGGTTEIVVNGSTGLLHPVGKEGVTPLAKNIVKLATHVERRLTMGKRGYERVKFMFLERHMAHRIAAVLKDVLQKAKNHRHWWLVHAELNVYMDLGTYEVRVCRVVCLCSLGGTPSSGTSITLSCLELDVCAILGVHQVGTRGVVMLGDGCPQGLEGRAKLGRARRVELDACADLGAHKVMTRGVGCLHRHGNVSCWMRTLNSSCHPQS